MDNRNPWALNAPIDSFFFDCDGTLSLIEGINVLATRNGVAEKVHQITARCMGKTGMTPKDYQQRLVYVQPTRNQVEELAASYIQHVAPGASELIQLLHRLNKKTYIISAGIKAAVVPFAHALGVPANHVLAVDVYFDAQGKYFGFDKQSNMTKANGKAVEIASVLSPGERSLLVGDGMSDWEARETVTRFIGFAGLSPKEWVKKHSDFYITNTSFYPIIALGLTQDELQQLPSQDLAYYEQGLREINNSAVLIKGNDHVHYSGS
ncbi:HAD-IB family phosphatase [Fluoribacter dumoffii]|uniref:phosphoserine phosphatase n=1 Tax=Fluoribacter dumoffii TaxID=463 RepID=A0A377G7S7_9GAMM|nr:HAD-IB family phosphatase [Fluoribacter dumoffii]KTC89568.1 phosphoserine phosphatase [Fluoribacter dumoffii NY 23]MCW8384762.1 HAD-IB family phosphatase [Fluoribacter dumoffii]MCW8417825.1 HAD-IB family phosphatase [Fluoribacter dumoffii]MCW8454333.1 HAD-IB family phosphatase [Fluoribacter dumoffii]MCW8461593.1 HAD-IB family phosphatase [Fluoribacter dumoffii]